MHRRILELEEALELRDTLLDELQKSLEQSQSETREMLQESRALQGKLEANARAQLAEKDKQISILQGMVGELRTTAATAATAAAQEDNDDGNDGDDGQGGGRRRTSHHVERPLHHDYLVTLLEERDTLADRMHDLSTDMILTKAQLAETNLKAERQAVRLRRYEREAKAAAESGGGSVRKTPSPTKPPRGAGATSQLAAAEEELAELRKELAMTKANLEHYQRTETNQRRKDSLRVGHLQEARQQVWRVGGEGGREGV